MGSPVSRSLHSFGGKAFSAAVFNRPRNIMSCGLNSRTRAQSLFEQVLKPMGMAGHREWRWVKNDAGPNDNGGLCKYEQVQIYAVAQEGR
jgi:hypothetical protein